MTWFIARPVFRKFILGLLCGLAPLLALASDSCRVVFDLGSSGIRAGASATQVIVRADYDYLGVWWAKQSLIEVVDSTVAALNDLPLKAGFPAGCRKVGGGFSVWRMAGHANVGELADILENVHSKTGVAILLIPQQHEGAYGYFGSRQVLGSRLTTTHVLDIGGGSLQISGEQTAYGDALGQKIWHQELCRLIRNTDTTPCALQPMTGKEVAIARSLLTERLKPVQEIIPGKVTLTAISRPVSRNVLPAMKQLFRESVDAEGFSRSAITQAIERLAPVTLSEAALQSGIEQTYAAYLISDMLLVEGVLQATRGNYLHVAEINLTNIPGLLNDDRAFNWELRYGCYLKRLRTIGLPAYDSEPASCPQ